MLGGSLLGVYAKGQTNGTPAGGRGGSPRRDKIASLGKESAP